jgi:hypothetical protein
MAVAEKGSRVGSEIWGKMVCVVCSGSCGLCEQLGSSRFDTRHVEVVQGIVLG